MNCAHLNSALVEAVSIGEYVHIKSLRCNVGIAIFRRKDRQTLLDCTPLVSAVITISQVF